MEDFVEAVNEAAVAAPIIPMAKVQVAATEAEGIEAQRQREAGAYERIVALSDRRAHWQNTVFKDSNDMLYGVLQGCYNLYADMTGKSVEASALRGALALLLKQRNIEVRESTHTMTKIVRCVLRSTRRCPPRSWPSSSTKLAALKSCASASLATPCRPPTRPSR